MMLKALVSAIILISASANNVDELCSAADAQLSCGQCIKAHEECGWCIDPHSPLTNRCQVKSKFTNETCTPHLVYSPQVAQVKVQQNMPLEALQHDGKTIVRMQPQAISVRLMPGHSTSVKFKYLHKPDASRRPEEQEIMEIQTSDVRESPLKLKFFIHCDGQEKETKSCRVKNNQIVEFRIEVSLESCSSNGDITMSVGVRGQRTIAGLYITAICGCECEKKPELNSRLCHQHGHLVCGQCVCDSTRGGDKCQCPLALHGVSSAIELENKCKENGSGDVCSGAGKCECGKCACAKPTISGKFCQCDNDSCPKSNGQLCSGNGVCDCGMCKCEHGWERDDCSCSTSNNNCIENGELCSNNGKCECNRCVCNPGKTGAFCAADDELAQPSTEQPVEDVESAPEAAQNDIEEEGDEQEEAPAKPDEELEKELDDSDSQACSSSILAVIMGVLIFSLFYR